MLVIPLCSGSCYSTISLHAHAWHCATLTMDAWPEQIGIAGYHPRLQTLLASILHPSNLEYIFSFNLNHAMHRSYYGAQRMSLVILGAHPLPEMQDWVHSLFKGVPSGDGPHITYPSAGLPFQVNSPASLWEFREAE